MKRYYPYPKIDKEEFRMSKSKKVLITGAGGFIGHHLVTYLKKKGYWVRGVDLKYPEFSEPDADEFEILDLRRWDNCLQATRGVDEVYALAADMGGMGYISSHHSLILHNNALINIHTLEAARMNAVKRYLFTSSACVYPEYKQTETDVVPLKEEDAYPAEPQDAYGWEKLIVERICNHYYEDYNLETRIIRFHNIFGPLGTWEGGREKAPAALCRKIAIAKLTGNHEIEIWGDGKQTRSFCYIDDCLRGLFMLIESKHSEPINLGQDRLVTIDELADIIQDVAGIKVKKKYIPGPQGVRGRNADITLIHKVLGWKPEISLEEGLARTYTWIEEQVRDKLEKEGALQPSQA
jgi:nucleoside-diphosphate-sugar epimerase